MIIKVLGAGCAKCKALEQKLINLKNQHQLDFEIEKVSQLNDIMAYGVMITPALVINEKIMCSGKIPRDEEILNWIKEVQSA
ncbi:MAG: TM0996/MTH895 family glutaredoxin-like protein [Calditrichaceae bacterium]|nr:TM0996/MTH895 family glutaredoxin-like protein [Calditrichaceae bacterium]